MAFFGRKKGNHSPMIPFLLPKHIHSQNFCGCCQQPSRHVRPKNGGTRPEYLYYRPFPGVRQQVSPIFSRKLWEDLTMPQALDFEYYTGLDTVISKSAHYRAPKFLFADENFKNLSAGAKILYSVLLDTNSLSVKNGWSDKHGQIYVNFTIERAKKLLNCYDKKVKSDFDELLKANMLLKVKLGQGNADRIYLKPVKNLAVNPDVYYQIPKFLFECECFLGLSNDAKLLYGALLDRTSLSLANRWQDKNGSIYVNFSLEEAQKFLSCAEKKARKSFKELIEAGLILKIRSGQGKADRIYLRKTEKSASQTGQNSDPRPDEDTIPESANAPEVFHRPAPNDDPKPAQSAIPEPAKPRPNLNDFNKMILTNQSSFNQQKFPVENYEDDYGNKIRDIWDFPMSTRAQEIEAVKESIGYDYTLELYPMHRELLDCIVGIMADVRSAKPTDKPFMWIDGRAVTLEEMRESIKMVDYASIGYIFDCIDSSDTEIHAIVPYLRRCLYSAEESYNAYTRAKVMHDMPWIGA
jgi:hypothetical protein